MNRFLWLMVIMPAIFTTAGAQVQVTTELDKNNILIGDQVTLKISVAPQPGISVQRVDYSAINAVEGLELLASKAPDTLILGGKTWMTTQELTLTSFDSGYYFIPPVTVHFLEGSRSDSTKSSDLALLVSTIPNISDSTQLAPIKNIIDEPLALSDTLPWMLGLLALIALVIAINYLRKRPTKEKPAPEEPVVVIPPHITALENLAKLKEEQLWQKGEIKAYHSRLSHIVRAYLEGRFKIPALESTTYEIMQSLQKRSDLADRGMENLRKLLETSDLVKFAKAEPDPGIHDILLQQAKAFVEANTAPEPENENS